MIIEFLKLLHCHLKYCSPLTPSSISKSPPTEEIKELYVEERVGDLNVEEVKEEEEVEESADVYKEDRVVVEEEKDKRWVRTVFPALFFFHVPFDILCDSYPL